MPTTTCDAAQPVSVLKEWYSHQLPFEMHCLGEGYYTRCQVSITIVLIDNYNVDTPWSIYTSHSVITMWFAFLHVCAAYLHLHTACRILSSIGCVVCSCTKCGRVMEQSLTDQE